MNTPLFQSTIVIAALAFACTACSGGTGAGSAAPSEGPSPGGSQAAPPSETGGSGAAASGGTGGSEVGADYSSMLHGRFVTGPNQNGPQGLKLFANGTIEVVYDDQTKYSNWAENEAYTRLQVARLCSRYPEAMQAPRLEPFI